MNYAPMPTFNRADIDRFWRHVTVGEPDACWPWKLSRFAGGYGQIKVAGRTLKAHRVAYFLHYHQDPGDQLVCHSCDNPPCCNPQHLFPGTEKDNVADCQQKGRLVSTSGEYHGSRTHPERWPRGERVAGAKLSLEQVRQIRERYAQGGVTQEKLAQEFGVTRRGIGQIIKGNNWRHAVADNEPVSLSDPKRRSRPGVYNHQAKLTENDARQIRQLHSEGVSPQDLALRFGVKRETVYHLLRGLTWRHVT